MSKHRSLSYARARLYLGITNVGFWVCLSSVVLGLGWAGQYFPTHPLAGKKLVVSLCIFLGGYIALQAPFDWLGGYLVPKAYRRYYGDFSDFVTNWLRGVSVQFLVLLMVAVSWQMFADWFPWIATGWMVLLLAVQMHLARLVGNFQSRGEFAWKSLDDAFTGGIAGLPGFQKPIFVTGRGQRLRAMDERRRNYLQRMILPSLGILLAVLFNLAGLLLASVMVHFPLNSVAGLVEIAMWFTIWSFLGLLILPSMSRPAVYAGDYALFSKGVSQEEFTQYLQSDPSQSGEESRGTWVERIFHPVPSPDNRIRAWGTAPGWSGCWHAARYALFLSWAGLSLLNRSVHCNIGKPNVWVLLPCD